MHQGKNVRLDEYPVVAEMKRPQQSFWVRHRVDLKGLRAGYQEHYTVNSTRRPTVNQAVDLDLRDDGRLDRRSNID